MAMKTLEYEGFLRGPGLLQLETVNKFFTIINQKPKFQACTKTVTEFCNEGELTSIVYTIAQKVNLTPNLNEYGLQQAAYFTMIFFYKGNGHWPTVILYGFKQTFINRLSAIFIGRETTYETIGHAAVMIGYTNQDSSL